MPERHFSLADLIAATDRLQRSDAASPDPPPLYQTVSAWTTTIPNWLARQSVATTTTGDQPMPRPAQHDAQYLHNIFTTYHAMASTARPQWMSVYPPRYLNPTADLSDPAVRLIVLTNLDQQAREWGPSFPTTFIGLSWQAVVADVPQFPAYDTMQSFPEDRWQALYWLNLYAALYVSGDPTATTRNRNAVLQASAARELLTLPVEERLARDVNFFSAADGYPFDSGWVLDPYLPDAVALNTNALFWFAVLREEPRRFLDQRASRLERRWRHAPRRMERERCQYGEARFNGVPATCFQHGEVVVVGGTITEPEEARYCPAHRPRTVAVNNDTRLWTDYAVFRYVDMGTMSFQYLAYRDDWQRDDNTPPEPLEHTARCSECDTFYVFPSDEERDRGSHSGYITTRCTNCGCRYAPRVIRNYGAQAPMTFLTATRESVTTRQRTTQRYCGGGGLGYLTQPPVPFFGIELEMEFMNAYDPETLLLNQQVPEQFIYKHDGSLRNGAELVTAPATFAWWQEQKEAWTARLNAFRHAGFRSFDPGSCGMHIHVSRNAFTATSAYTLQSFVYENPAFMQFLAQRGENSYATYDGDDANSKDRRIAKARLVRGDDCDSEHDNRYEAINIPLEHHTIEFRMFRGTLNPASFYKNIECAASLTAFVTSAGLKDAQSAIAYLAFIERHAAEYPHLVAYLRRYDTRVRHVTRGATTVSRLPVVDPVPTPRVKKQRPSKLARVPEFAAADC